MDACVELGSMYLNGPGMNEDYKKQKNYMKRHVIWVLVLVAIIWVFYIDKVLV